VNDDKSSGEFQRRLLKLTMMKWDAHQWLHHSSELDTQTLGLHQITLRRLLL